jgi:type II secretory pathway predicted ATPase ExeA
MIRAHFGIDKNPFTSEACEPLPHQQEILDTLKVHSQQGGFCVVMGHPGTGKSVIRDALLKGADKRVMVASVSRTMQTYSNTVRILCQAFGVEHAANNYKCERNLIAEAVALKQAGRAVLTLIDDAHLMEIDTLRKLRLLFADFPHNNNLVLFGQPTLLSNLSLGAHEDIRSRITYSVVTPRLGPDDMESFLHGQLDRCGLPHSTFIPEAMGLIVRTADGLMRRARNMALSCLLEAVRARKRSVDLDNVNRVLMQPHWREERDFEAKTIS